MAQNVEKKNVKNGFKRKPEHSSTQTKTYCVSPGVNLLTFLRKNNRSNGLHKVSELKMMHFKNSLSL